MNPLPELLVVDASAAVKRVLEEAWSDNVAALFAAGQAERRPVVGPPHLVSESVNAIYQRTRTNRPDIRLTNAEAEAALAAFLRLPIHLMSPAGLYERAFDFARRYGLPSTYDSLYVALAQLLGVELWTADRRLVDAVGVGMPWVRWIGDFPLTAGGRVEEG